MTSAFISYSHADRPVADFIAAHLYNRGVEKVFIDYLELRAGDFVSQLGSQIEESEYFLVVITPRSVASKWVRSEIGWAFANKESEYIIPIWLEPASLTDVFVLGQIQRVDFTRWNDDRKMDGAIQELARLMNLPRDPITEETVPPEPLRGDTDDQIPQDHERDSAVGIPPPAFARGDVSSMFDAGLSVESNDPEQALFLYEQVLENDPEFMDGRIQQFVEDKRRDLKPARLRKLTERIENAKQQGNWTEVIQLGKSMTDIDAANAFALEQIKSAEQSAIYEPFYRRAVGASENGNQDAVNNLMKYIYSNCPDYGDPAELLVGQPISRDLLGYLHNTHTLVGHNSPINDVAFSSDGKLLATASEDHSVKVWSVSNGTQKGNLNEHEAPVNAVSFSPDGMLLASVSSDGGVRVWNVKSLELVASADLAVRLNGVVFSHDGNLLATAGAYGKLYVHQVPNINAFDSTEIDGDYFDYEITGIVFSSGMILYSSAMKRRKIGLEVDYDYIISAWNLASLSDIRVSPVQEDIDGAFDRLKISTDCKHLASVGHDGIHVWELPQGSKYWHYFNPSEDLLGSDRTGDAEFLPDNSALLIAAMNDYNVGKLHFLDLSDKKAVATIDAHEEAITCVALSRDSRLLATGSEDRLVKVWQLL